MSNFSYPWIEPSGDHSKALDASIRSSAIGHVLALDGNEHEVYDTVENVLYVIDRANLDPVRVGVREFLDTLHANDDTKHFDKSTLEALERLEAVL